MLNMGFLADLVDIYQFLRKPDARDPIKAPNTTRLQTMLFSATIVPSVQDLVKRLAPTHISADLNPRFLPAEGSKLS